MSSNFPHIPFVVLDTETTGLVSGSDHIVELALVRYEEGEKVAEYESLFVVDTKMSPVARVLTRLSEQDLADAPLFTVEQDRIEELTRGAILIGQNLGFDLGMLKGDGLDLTDRPWMDTAMLASIVYPEAKSFSLGYLSAFLQLPHEPMHRAMGDVVATTALLGKVWGRLKELPTDVVQLIQEYAERGPEGYAALFSALTVQGKDMPSWTSKTADEDVSKNPLPAPQKKRTWRCVKNLDATLRIVDANGYSPIFAPQFVLDLGAAERLSQQESFSADELTLLAKLAIYHPKTHRDFPMHGTERDVWKGKLACTRESKEYTSQYTDGCHPLLDHRQLLELLLHDHSHAPKDGDVVVIDNASMLEDTATKALKWSVSTDPLRAAVENVGTKEAAQLQSFLDAYQIWIEKVRNFQDIRYLVDADLQTREARGVRERLTELMNIEFTDQVREQLENLEKIINPENLPSRIAYIEQFRDGGQILQSVPFDIAADLKKLLYDRFETTLILPPGEAATFMSIVPLGCDAMPTILNEDLPKALELRYGAEEMTLDRLLPRIDGRVICLVSSKRSIEQLAVKYMVSLEQEGVTLIAQGLSGGLGRMQSEFLAAGDRVVWLLTPWMYEGVELPEGSVDRLWLQTLPFDHPNHAVLSRRADHYGREAFNAYFIPRLLHRLFRLVRLFANHCEDDADVLVLDQRLQTKGYGKTVMEYLGRFTKS